MPSPGWSIRQVATFTDLMPNIEQHDSIASIKLLDGALENDGNDDEEVRLRKKLGMKI